MSLKRKTCNVGDYMRKVKPDLRGAFEQSVSGKGATEAALKAAAKTVGDYVKGTQIFDNLPPYLKNTSENVRLSLHKL